ncbi:MAG: hypothetical protein QNJ14_12970 [Woeseiaceae bacterium]|nr:hypothetical protein [Woeseiaceae bacterium]
MGAGKIIHILGVVVALIAGLMGGFEYSALLIVILGAVGGWFVNKDDASTFLITTLALAAVSGAWGPIPELGQYVSGALGGLSSLFNAAAVTVIVVGVAKRLMP